MTVRVRSLLFVLLLPMLAPVAEVSAQRRGRGNIQAMLGDPNEFYTPPEFRGNAKYDGRFTFARIKYRGFMCFQREGPGWSHDYPRAESHFMRIMRAVTAMRPFVEHDGIEGGNIIALDDPNLFKYPVAYLSEPGGWRPTGAEAAALGKYLAKGGFLIVDDFEENCSGDGDMANFAAVMGQVLPKGKIMEVPASHPIFDSFYKIDLGLLGGGRRSQATWLGVFQDNDPKKRLMVIANYMNDIGEAWQWSDQGFNIAPTNEAYKLGVNYIIYALTH
ncbi:MAG: DUF4159 domain-containing protein [Gemmatimonadota bacterium]